MTRNISETNVINCYWMKLCKMVNILTCLVCCVNCICHVLHTQKKRSNSTPQHEVTFYRGHRLHIVWFCVVQYIDDAQHELWCNWLIYTYEFSRHHKMNEYIFVLLQHKSSPREIKRENTRFVSFLQYKSLYNPNNT